MEKVLTVWEEDPMNMDLLGPYGHALSPMAKYFRPFFWVILLSNLIKLKALLWKPISSSSAWSKSQSQIWHLLALTYAGFHLTVSGLLRSMPKWRVLDWLRTNRRKLCWPPFTRSYLQSWFKVLFVNKTFRSSHNHNLLWHCSTTTSFRTSDFSSRLQNIIHHSHLTHLKYYVLT